MKYTSCEQCRLNWGHRLFVFISPSHFPVIPVFLCFRSSVRIPVFLTFACIIFLPSNLPPSCAYSLSITFLWLVFCHFSCLLCIPHFLLSRTHLILSLSVSNSLLYPFPILTLPIAFFSPYLIFYYFYFYFLFFIPPSPHVPLLATLRKFTPAPARKWLDVMQHTLQVFCLFHDFVPRWQHQ